jgi:hypothetical protein
MVWGLDSLAKVKMGLFREKDKKKLHKKLPAGPPTFGGSFGSQGGQPCL